MQQIFSDADYAIEKALELSKQNPEAYFTVIKSNDRYYVEDDSPLVRVWETVIGTWHKGKKEKP